jgi:hypothetical protein
MVPSCFHQEEFGSKVDAALEIIRSFAMEIVVTPGRFELPTLRLGI